MYRLPTGFLSLSERGDFGAYPGELLPQPLFGDAGDVDGERLTRAACGEHTGGNPLYCRALLEDLSVEGPSSRC